MKDKYILKIDNPCSQDWNAMDETREGKYCSSCSKNVIDFRRLSDQEVLALIRKADGKLCGNFNPAQLNRLLTDQTQASGPGLRKILAGLLLVSGPGLSYGMSPKAAVEITEQRFSNDELHLDKDSSGSVFKGSVVDKETKEVIPFARIKIKNTDVFCRSDVDGNFELNIPENLLSDTMFFVIRAYIDSDQEIEYQVLKKDLSSRQKIFVIEADPEIIEMIGDVSYRKKRWWESKRKFR